MKSFIKFAMVVPVLALLATACGEPLEDDASVEVDDAELRASLDKIRNAIASDMDGLLGDTVNEGEGFAAVKRAARGKPVMGCTIRRSRDDASKEWFFCTVTFEVRPSEDGELGDRTCALSYSVRSRNVSSLTRGPDERFTSCIETLGESD